MQIRDARQEAGKTNSPTPPPGAISQNSPRPVLGSVCSVTINITTRCRWFARRKNSHRVLPTPGAWHECTPALTCGFPPLCVLQNKTSERPPSSARLGGHAVPSTTTTTRTSEICAVQCVVSPRVEPHDSLGYVGYDVESIRQSTFGVRCETREFRKVASAFSAKSRSCTRERRCVSARDVACLIGIAEVAVWDSHNRRAASSATWSSEWHCWCARCCWPVRNPSRDRDRDQCPSTRISSPFTCLADRRLRTRSPRNTASTIMDRWVLGRPVLSIPKADRAREHRAKGSSILGRQLGIEIDRVLPLSRTL